MGLLNEMNNPEVDLFLAQFYESAKLLGNASLLEQLNPASSSDLYNDPNYIYEPALEVDIILDENPEIRYLKSLGWYVEGAEMTFILAKIPARTEQGVDLDIREGVRVTIGHKFHPDGWRGGRSFLISNVKGSGTQSLFYICKLVPTKLIDRNTQKHDDPKTPEVETEENSRLDTLNNDFLNIPKGKKKRS
ncbi:hypothetical protein HSE3_gp068 [Bacillus phage vB_BceM-HSE3]|nr:hypothetical protein HSE3_gp068 [Bacillus phage vB_BceM-HSE3]